MGNVVLIEVMVLTGLVLLAIVVIVNLSMMVEDAVVSILVATVPAVLEAVVVLMNGITILVNSCGAFVVIAFVKLRHAMLVMVFVIMNIEIGVVIEVEIAAI